MSEQAASTNASGHDTPHRFSKPVEREVMRRGITHLAAFVAAVISLLSSLSAIWNGNAWLAALAIVLTGIAHLLPAFFDYQRTRRALEARRQKAGPIKPVKWPESTQTVAWPEPSSPTIH